MQVDLVLDISVCAGLCFSLFLHLLILLFVCFDQITKELGRWLRDS